MTYQIERTRRIGNTDRYEKTQILGTRDDRTQACDDARAMLLADPTFGQFPPPDYYVRPIGMALPQGATAISTARLADDDLDAYNDEQ